MKRFKLGFTLMTLGGCLLFGMAPRSAEASGSLDTGEAAATFEATFENGNANAKVADTVHASLGVKPSTTPLALAEGATCGKGMVEVEGDYCPYLEQKCVRWLDPETKMRCAEFAPTSGCHGKTVKKHFCIDQFEYPNQPGAKPVVMTTWIQADATCSKEGKRLCNETEWTLACEGQEHLPYPYGYTRNSEACNIDKPHPDVDEKALANASTRDAEVARLDQRDPSGAREACVSPYGVYDMTGNVDEWVINESGKPFKSGLKGGYWGPVRDRCRPMTTAHNEEFSFYQIGFRCCGEPVSTPGGKLDKPAGLEHSIGTSPGGSQGTILTGS
jgi:sulfatase modifying factor 1